MNLKLSLMSQMAILNLFYINSIKIRRAFFSCIRSRGEGSFPCFIPNMLYSGRYQLTHRIFFKLKSRNKPILQFHFNVCLFFFFRNLLYLARWPSYSRISMKIPIFSCFLSGGSIIFLIKSEDYFFIFSYFRYIFSQKRFKRIEK